ncbi:hypothetical protein IGL98_000115 [Enterococcus sp. DIV0840]|uniref:hypothetical protein n=1 Tax=Enterococcus TaxID=1350 RepID=UPI001A8F54F5|nr:MULTISPECIES: hypothetical protein [Enterococcus]MBO0433904.1 hypothetical protein [Enterococcus sp. DIV0849a]MBO0475098.1 hypothetical protein [Enterococcus ureasiticus]
MSNKFKWILVGGTVFFCFFWYTHRSPEVSVRTAVFSAGYFSIANNSKIEKIDDEFYTITPAPVEMATNSELKTYHVSKNYIFYFAEYYGEA